MAHKPTGRPLGEWLEAQRLPGSAEIAREAGVTRQFVSRVLHGQARPTPAIVAACKKLGLPKHLVGLMR